jgi:hypothetical protein
MASLQLEDARQENCDAHQRAWPGCDWRTWALYLRLPALAYFLGSLQLRFE